MPSVKNQVKIKICSFAREHCICYNKVFLWSRSGAAQPQIRERNPANRICTWKNNYLKLHFRVGFFCCFDASVRNERKDFVFVRVTFKESVLRDGVQASVRS